MGTRADFYDSSGDKPQWLASIAWDGYPEGIKDEVLAAETPEEFREKLTEFLSERDDVTLPERGWPWPWEDSNTTDYAYHFIDGRVYASCFGSVLHAPDFKTVDDEGEEVEPRPTDEYPHSGEGPEHPDMSDIQNVRFDNGSGLIIIEGGPSHG